MLEHKEILDNNLANSLLKFNKTLYLLNNLEIQDKLSLKGHKTITFLTIAPILYFKDLLNLILEVIQEAFNLLNLHQCPINFNFKLNKKRILMLIKRMFKH
jgi:hypothetical protein